MSEKKIEVVLGWTFEKEPVLVVRGDEKAVVDKNLKDFINILPFPVKKVKTNLGGNAIMPLWQKYAYQLQDEAGEYFGILSSEMIREHLVAVHTSR